MIENVAVYLLLFVLAFFVVIIPVVIVFNRKRKSALKQVLFTCDPQGTKLKAFVAEKMKNEGFLKKLMNEAVYSFKPYIDSYLHSELRSGIIKESDLDQYSAYEKKVKFLIKSLVGGIALILIILVFVGLANI